MTRGQPLGPIGEQAARRVVPDDSRLSSRGARSRQTPRAARTETPRGLDGAVLGPSGLRLVQTQTDLVNWSALISVRAARERC